MQNPKINITKITVLADEWNTLKKVKFDYKTKKGIWQEQLRECYTTGEGACILLYNTKKHTIILTKQFRMPTYLSGIKDGMMIEVCAGLLDDDDPDTCIKKEVLEETGYKIDRVQKVFELYSTPGTVSEKLHYYIGEYNDGMKINAGGGLDSEQEEIEVLEYDFNNALNMIKTGEIIDARTVILLHYAKIERLLE